MQLLRNAPTGIAMAVLFILAAALAWFTIPFLAAVRVEVQLPVFDVDRIGAGSQLNVTVTNSGSRPIEPSFWVVWSAFTRRWSIVQGPSSVDPGSVGRYVIRPADIQTAIPEGALFIVKAYIPDYSTYYRSATVELHLAGIVPIRNPDLSFWALNFLTGVYQPLAWTAVTSGGSDDIVNLNAQASGSGADMYLREGGTGSAASYIHLQQEIPVRGLVQLYSKGMKMCWQQTVDYRAEPASGAPIVGSGLELFGGGQRAWFVVSSNTSGVHDLPGLRVFVAQADPSRSGCASVPIGGMVDFVDPGLQSSALLILFVAAWPTAAGSYRFSPTCIS